VSASAAAGAVRRVAGAAVDVASRSHGSSTSQQQQFAAQGSWCQLSSSRPFPGQQPGSWVKWQEGRAGLAEGAWEGAGRAQQESVLERSTCSCRGRSIWEDSASGRGGGGISNRQECGGDAG